MSSSGRRRIKIPRNEPEQGRDLVWEAFVGLVQDDNADFEELWNVPVEQTDITMRAARAMKHATGHESLQLFRLGYMLYIVRSNPTYTLDDLKNVASPDWVIPEDDFNLSSYVRDMVFFPCHLVTKTSNEELRNFMQNAPNPYQMPDELRMFLEGSGPDGTRSIPHTTFLPILVIEAVMCAEIWCVWASRQQSPMPSPEAFMGLFSPTAAAHVKGLAKRLRKVSTMEVLWDHFLLFYSGSVEFLANYDALKNLARAI